MSLILCCFCIVFTEISKIISVPLSLLVMLAEMTQNEKAVGSF